MVVFGEKFTGGKTVDAPVSLVDIYPTLASVVGLGPEHVLTGIDLGKFVDASDEKLRNKVVVYYRSRKGKKKAVVTDEWFFI